MLGEAAGRIEAAGALASSELVFTQDAELDGLAERETILLRTMTGVKAAFGAFMVRDVGVSVDGRWDSARVGRAPKGPHFHEAIVR